MKKKLTVEEVCQQIYEEGGYSKVFDHIHKQQKDGNPAYKDVTDEFCVPCENEMPSLNHICLVCGSTTEPLTMRHEIMGLYPESKMHFYTGFDAAILGVDTNPWTKEADKDDDSTERVVYSVREIMIILMDQGMDYDMAREYFDFNIKGGYIGVHTPIFVEDEELSERSEISNKSAENISDIAEAWNELEELNTNFNELSDEDLTELRETIHQRIKKALGLLDKYVPDTIGEN